MLHLSDHVLPSAVPFGAPLDALENVARDLRYQAVQMSHRASTPHLGSVLSCIDIVVAAYWRILRLDPSQPAAPTRDRFILSKGHAAPALYTALAARGFFPESWLDSFATHRAKLAEQPAPNCAPGVELATGSLGHGLPVGCGFALSARIQRQNYRTIVVLSDGECNEGAVWEAAMFAAAKKLGRLTVVIDYNKWQATGRSDEVLALPSLREKWSAFGWSAVEVDGHDLSALVRELSGHPAAIGQPKAIVAHTVKGKGVPFMENDNNWHYRVPDAAEVAAAAQHLAHPVEELALAETLAP
jgi:transketolase